MMYCWWFKCLLRIEESAMRLLLTALMLVSSTACVKRFPVESPVEPSSTSPQVLRFTAQPHVIHRGETAVLSWTVRNASLVELEEALEPDGSLSDRFLHLVGRYSGNGTVTVSPRSSATYVLSCGPQALSGPVCVSASVSVVVK
jgi:hypothetical protein